jgi:hypothetical protein
MAGYGYHLPLSLLLQLNHHLHPCVVLANAVVGIAASIDITVLLTVTQTALE